MNLLCVCERLPGAECICIFRFLALFLTILSSLSLSLIFRYYLACDANQICFVVSVYGIQYDLVRVSSLRIK